MEDVLKEISKQELPRMYEAVLELFNCHLSHLAKGANKIAPNRSITFPKMQLSKGDGEPTIGFPFQAGFEEYSWRERGWWTFWLVEETIYETKIPSLEALLKNWKTQAKQAELEIINEISRCLLEQIDSLEKNVGEIQNDIIDRYRARLDKAHQEITLDYEQQRNIWQNMQQKAQNLAEDFSSLETLLKQK